MLLRCCAPAALLQSLRVRAAARSALRPLCCSRTAEAGEDAGRVASRVVGGSAGGELIDTQPVRGTRDFPPEELRLRNWLFGHFREARWRARRLRRPHAAQVSLLYGFEEWDAPVVESEALYTRKGGEEITGQARAECQGLCSLSPARAQLYSFQDKSERRLSLRPELTPSLARLLLGRCKGTPLPAKWFAVGQCWRYERMTRGRRREHYQWNMDVVGVAGVAAEAELLAAITSFFSRVGLCAADVGVRVSSRKLLSALLSRAGVPEAAFAPVCVAVDKLEKSSRESVLGELEALGLPQPAAQQLLDALQLRSLDQLAALLGEEAEAVRDLRALWALANAYGYQDWLVFDATTVRGLSYYTGVVFEAFDRAGSLRAICGGGRYDRLLSAYGGEDLPCAGFGFGDAVIVELLAERGLLPDPGRLRAPCDVLAPLDEGARGAAAALAAALRAAGRRCDLLLEPPRKAKTLAKRAAALGGERLLLLGGEVAPGSVRVKTLASFEETTMTVEALLASATQA